MWGKKLLFVAVCALAAPVWATNFAVLLGDSNGSTDAGKNVREIAIDELNIDVVDKVAQRDGWRLYGPGKPHWGNARVVIEPGADTAFFDWYQEAAKGKSIRKNITVTLFKSDKTPGRSYGLIDCFPTRWEVGAPDATGQPGAEVLTVSIGGIVFSTDGGGAATRGPVVVLDAAGNPADSFESWGGGEPGVLLTPIFSGAQYRTNSPGHKTVGELSLRGKSRPTRKVMYQWFNDMGVADPPRHTIGVVEQGAGDGSVRKGRTYTYFDCFPVRYVFPRISVDGPAEEDLMEVVVVKPIRIEMK